MGWLGWSCFLPRFEVFRCQQIATHVQRGSNASIIAAKHDILLKQSLNLCSQTVSHFTTTRPVQHHLNELPLKQDNNNLWYETKTKQQNNKVWLSLFQQIRNWNNIEVKKQTNTDKMSQVQQQDRHTRFQQGTPGTHNTWMQQSSTVNLKRCYVATLIYSVRLRHLLSTVNTRTLWIRHTHTQCNHMYNYICNNKEHTTQNCYSACDPSNNITSKSYDLTMLQH